jgi:hypothetical protein
MRKAAVYSEPMWGMASSAKWVGAAALVDDLFA